VVNLRLQVPNLHSIKHFGTEPTRRDFGISDARIDATNDSCAATIAAEIVGTHSSTEEITPCDELRLCLQVLSFS
jgi:hypothetical protein